MDFVNCKVFISNVDSQSSMSGGVIVQVLGEMSNNDSICRKFSQTFFLAEQPDGYYVLNDIFRFLKEDIENDYDFEESNDRNLFNFQDARVKAGRTVGEVSRTTQVNGTVTESSYVRDPSPVKENVSKGISMEPQLSNKPSFEKEKIETTVAPSVVAPAPPIKKEARPAKPEAEELNARSKSPSKRQNSVASWSKIVSTDPKPIQPRVPPTSKSTAPFKPPMKEEESADGFKEITRTRTNDRRSIEGKPTTYLDKDRNTIYIKFTSESIDRKALADTFENEVGPVSGIDVVAGRKMAFVTFKNQESVTKCIGRTFLVNGESVIAEERRRPGSSGNKKFDNYNRNGNTTKPGRGGKINQPRKPGEKERNV
jgi:hypothetical protein